MTRNDRLDLQEALEFAAAGKVRATVATERLENINDVTSGLQNSRISGPPVVARPGSTAFRISTSGLAWAINQFFIAVFRASSSHDRILLRRSSIRFFVGP